MGCCLAGLASLLVDGDLHLHAGLDHDGGDVLDGVGGGVQVDDALVDAHLEAVPRVGALTAGGLARRDLEHLGGQAAAWF